MVHVLLLKVSKHYITRTRTDETQVKKEFVNSKIGKIHV